MVRSIFARQPPNHRFENLKRLVLHRFNLCAFASLREILFFGRVFENLSAVCHVILTALNVGGGLAICSCAATS